MKETIAVIGGTGFIGTRVVKHLRDVGFAVSVMARTIENLPALFQNEDVRLTRGDIQSVADVRDAIAGATRVVNLVHGDAEVIAEACLKGGVPLIQVSSIAALYLGPQPAAITGTTSMDLRADRRPYARAKALSEERLLRLKHDPGLRVCILRPGLVIGAGTSPFHSGLGSCKNKQDCIGWNAGQNPLPFVLVDDVARAIVLACTHPIADGKIYNLVGDVRPSAREYLAELSQTLGRPLRFYGRSPERLYLKSLCIWLLRRLRGRDVARPSLQDIRSRGLKAEFDCSDIKNDLGWTPVADKETFYRRAFETL